AHGLALLGILGTDRAAADGYLSDQPWTSMANENGPVERDMSNGGSGVGDGRALSLNGSRHAKGLGTWAPSAMEFRPDGSCSTFTAVIGIDDEVGSRGSVIFQVWGDGRKIFDSGVMTGTTPAQNLQVDLSGIRSLRREPRSRPVRGRCCPASRSASTVRTPRSREGISSSTHGTSPTERRPRERWSRMHTQATGFSRSASW